jgi:hypothetical protein
MQVFEKKSDGKLVGWGTEGSCPAKVAMKVCEVNVMHHNNFYLFINFWKHLIFSTTQNDSAYILSFDKSLAMCTYVKIYIKPSFLPNCKKHWRTFSSGF